MAPLIPPDQGEGGLGVGLPAACEYMEKMTTSGNSGGTTTMYRRQNPHLTSPWSEGGIAVLFRHHEPYADLRNLGNERYGLFSPQHGELAHRASRTKRRLLWENRQLSGSPTGLRNAAFANLHFVLTHVRAMEVQIQRCDH